MRLAGNKDREFLSLLYTNGTQKSREAGKEAAFAGLYTKENRIFTAYELLI